MRTALLRSRGTRAVVAATIVALAAPLVTMAASAGAAPLGSGPIRYVALGDSRAAAPSLTSLLEPSGCARSGQGYPYRVKAALRPASFTDATCVAATTDDVVDRGQRTPVPPFRMTRPQVDALRSDTNLVTVSIGGNDIAWASLLQPCFGLTDQIDSGCRRDTRLRARQDAALTALLPKLQRTLDAIRQRSPQARVVVVGHGGYYGATGCFPTATVSRADLVFVADFFRRFDATIARAAASRGDTFVDIAGPAVGHDACAPIGTRWFAGQFPSGLTPPNHPTPLGSASMGDLVLRALRS
ncbi:SGNH/GDSL hydrolase family protein [Williamsia serinedens]|uniref:GDSL-like Lipase/Acylhydrolase family protein n=1 Tax=Williamsia serinedens TaxID=391736 RepID=A0ABT1H0H1_9NOCA|nr:SGNH/GDSL hydrolase family protein [Williamsia serinedens]MCP2160742.1 GDSL-like Lipase/Acylhydrolase family protein [Williamsia serinedens]